MRIPHTDQPVVAKGAPLETARGVMILVHGRGASAADILSIAHELNHPTLAYFAPQAAGNTWYPYPFLEPTERNEPYLSSALAVLDGLVSRATAAGIPAERIFLGGFSQGGCLALEFAARNPRRYAGIFGLSGALIGPETTPRDAAGSLEGTPVFLGCSDEDFHIPKECVLDAAEVLTRLGGTVTTRLYPRMGHQVNFDEVEFIRAMVTAAIG